MLGSYNEGGPLPNDDVVYAAFRLAAAETVYGIMQPRVDASDTFGDDEPAGFLTEVPFLEGVPLEVQVDLLAEVWAKHRARRRYEGTILDAAVFYSACYTAARLVCEEPALARAYLKDGPRVTKLRMGEALAEK